MPTYDYECDACSHRFEEFQSITEQPLKKCPQCKKPKLRRLIGTGAAIIFKGSGFYQTDYRSESYKSAAKAEESKASTNGEAAKSDGARAKSDNAQAATGTTAATGAKETTAAGAKSKKGKS